VSTLRRRPGVDDDIYELAAYLLDQSEDVARPFVDAVEETLQELAGRPGVGSPKHYSHPELVGLSVVVGGGISESPDLLLSAA
jgi:plasmid stabilization system protein ParE